MAKSKRKFKEIVKKYVNLIKKGAWTYKDKNAPIAGTITPEDAKKLMGQARRDEAIIQAGIKKLKESMSKNYDITKPSPDTRSREEFLKDLYNKGKSDSEG